MECQKYYGSIDAPDDVAVCGGTIAENWAGPASMNERPDCLEVFAYKDSHPNTRGRFQRARSRRRAYAKMPLTETENAGIVPDDPERRAVFDLVLDNRAKLAAERERIKT